MILQALTKYYDLLSADPESGIAPPGYSVANVSFVLVLAEDGELRDILPLVDMVPQGKKMVERPRKMIVPEQVKRAVNVSANFLCDTVPYFFGIPDESKTDPEYSSKRFKAFRELNVPILTDVDSLGAHAVLNFLDRYSPDDLLQNPLIILHQEKLAKGGNLIFKLEGRNDFVHDDLLIRHQWEQVRLHGDSSGLVGQCMITGEQTSIARLHPNLKGVAGTNSAGGSLVGFNASAYESYNRTKGQGLNAPVGEQSVFAYTTALNYLLSSKNPNGKFRIDDTTVVYWAESSSPKYAEVFADLFQIGWVEDEPETDPEAQTEIELDSIDLIESEQATRDQKAEQLLSEIGKKIRSGDALDITNVMEGLNPETRFYVLGLAPNAARVSVRFFHQDAFQKIVEKILRHYQDLEIKQEYPDQPKWIPLYRIMAETYSKKSTDKKSSPLLSGSVMRSILSGVPYPSGLFTAVINRVRADMDDSKKGIQKINYIRAAIIKAYLIRKYRSYPNHRNQEVLGMALNEQSTNQAYLLGRLFAVLEKAQKDAIPNLNATIKDRYFTTACASPSAVFPILLRLSQHHISKAEYGYISDRQIERIMNQLDITDNPIPAHLSLDEQGIFVLGYYHQRAAFYAGKSATGEKSNDQSSEKNGENNE